MDIVDTNKKLIDVYIDVFNSNVISEKEKTAIYLAVKLTMNLLNHGLANMPSDAKTLFMALKEMVE